MSEVQESAVHAEEQSELVDLVAERVRPGG